MQWELTQVPLPPLLLNLQLYLPPETSCHPEGKMTLAQGPAPLGPRSGSATSAQRARLPLLQAAHRFTISTPIQVGQHRI